MTDRSEKLPDPRDLDLDLDAAEAPLTDEGAGEEVPLSELALEFDDPEQGVATVGSTIAAALEPTQADAEADASDEPPVLPEAFDTDEPQLQQSTPKPSVEPPSKASLDLDALLSDIGVDDGAQSPAQERSVFEEPIGDQVDAGLDLDGDSEDLHDPEEEAPPLPLSEDEPAAVPALGADVLKPDAETIETLKRLAGPGADPEAAREALFAAISGKEYDARALPDARTMLLGLARMLAATGFSVNEMVDAIIDAMLE